MIDCQRIFHAGLLVCDLDVAMKEIGAALGLTWATPWEYRPMKYWTPKGEVTTPLLRVTYSKEGPQHVELIQGSPGGFWECSPQRGVHHVGVWSDNLTAEAGALVKQGWKPEAAALSPEEGWGRFCYMRAPTAGILLELITTEYKALMESRWAEPPCK